MGNSPVDRDINYMREMWGTTKLATDYINYYENEEMNPQNDFLDNLANQQYEKLCHQRNKKELEKRIPEDKTEKPKV